VWHSMFAIQIPIAEKVLRTVLVYATILILFRLTGKEAEQSASKDDIADLSAQLKTIQASLELLAASR
jgi:hypothetical protein